MQTINVPFNYFGERQAKGLVKSVYHCGCVKFLTVKDRRYPTSLWEGFISAIFALFFLQPRRGGLSVEDICPPSENPVGMTSTTFDKIFTHPLAGFAILQTRRSFRASFFEENASESNATHSETIAGKLIDISIPAILWSYGRVAQDVHTSLAPSKPCMRLSPHTAFPVKN